MDVLTSSVHVIWATLDLEFDEGYLANCRIPSFNPQLLKISNMEILLTLGRMFGPGITRNQIARIMRMCIQCRNFCFVERRHLHRCNGAVLLTQSDNFDLITSICSYEGHAGLSSFDMVRLFTCCGVCERVCLEGTLGLHDCPGA